MANIYSTYEAKARFSEILRHVRSGETVTVTYHGEPVAEIRPLRKEAAVPLESRLRELERRSVLKRSKRRGKLRPLARRPGALERFLAERDG